MKYRMTYTRFWQVYGLVGDADEIASYLKFIEEHPEYKLIAITIA